MAEIISPPVVLRYSLWRYDDPDEAKAAISVWQGSVQGSMHAPGQVTSEGPILKIEGLDETGHPVVGRIVQIDTKLAVVIVGPAAGPAAIRQRATITPEPRTIEALSATIAQTLQERFVLAD